MRYFFTLFHLYVILHIFFLLSAVFLTKITRRKDQKNIYIYNNERSHPNFASPTTTLPSSALTII